MEKITFLHAGRVRVPDDPRAHYFLQI